MWHYTNRQEMTDLKYNKVQSELTYLDAISKSASKSPRAGQYSGQKVHKSVQIFANSLH
jgi:hypothetical protein